MMEAISKTSIAVVIPCYQVKSHIQQVLEAIPDLVNEIFCVDDACPDKSGDFIESISRDKRVTVIRHQKNRGVGGAMLTGFGAALGAGHDIAVKIDGDGQMDPQLIPLFINPIISGQADYTKGNRFWDSRSILEMPKVRVFGNAILGFLNKFSSGYWRIMDPTNGYVAIHLSVFALLDSSKIANNYFFESDMLFRLNVARAVVQDIPMEAKYGTEVSNLKIHKIVFPFLAGHLRNASKRFVYSYLLRDFSLASIEFLLGPLLVCFGVLFGAWHWYLSSFSGLQATPGQVMLAALPMIGGLQLILSALNFDMTNEPRIPLQQTIRRSAALKDNSSVDGGGK
ncbi:glycosyltransferase family 2 protein [Kiloniella laminariae]|uniref:Glycosyltransferase family 2 protein n=1 Tax=Kiloniella laminariae TaxID=454162 RepID=A0ABT4LKL4_9PROT|nr:glycosyltransferase family 2 protein [Kiloniella laminariae]MCZ4280906.1 glycosyltransferase family 2 protein [Kiloniella laminariae]